jgi:hypothetical protein
VRKIGQFKIRRKFFLGEQVFCHPVDPQVMIIKAETFCEPVHYCKLEAAIIKNELHSLVTVNEAGIRENGSNNHQPWRSEGSVGNNPDYNVYLCQFLKYTTSSLLLLPALFTAIGTFKAVYQASSCFLIFI